MFTAVLHLTIRSSAYLLNDVQRVPLFKRKFVVLSGANRNTNYCILPAICVPSSHKHLDPLLRGEGADLKLSSNARKKANFKVRGGVVGLLGRQGQHPKTDSGPPKKEEEECLLKFTHTATHTIVMYSS